VSSTEREPVCVGVELAARDPGRLADFYANALGFACETSTSDTVTLTLRRACVTFKRAAPSGRRIPPDSRSHDHWFRHLALVVRDVAAARERMSAHGGIVTSESAQTLPDWNPASSGIGAMYFRDPEDHPLELIHFPPGKGKAIWHEQGEDLFQGIDHTAIVVSSAQRSIEYYREAFGFGPAAAALNRGLEQERLTRVEAATVHVISLPGKGEMGLELLEYLQPTDGRAIPDDTTPDDLWWSRLVLRLADSAGPHRQWLDPDNHGVLTI
jgi:catechol 2,3-dioxygenase-like lactoylglutathione lyase family enzyme